MIPYTKNPYPRLSEGPVVRQAPAPKPKKKLTEYEQLKEKIPHYMRDKVDHLIEEAVKARVSEHMNAFKKEVDRELED